MLKPGNALHHRLRCVVSANSAHLPAAGEELAAYRLPDKTGGTRHKRGGHMATFAAQELQAGRA